MKMFNPTEFMNHTVEEGMRPKVGFTERSQPNTRPEISAPPAVESVSGTPLTRSTTAPINAPKVIAPAIKATSATSLGRSGTPNSFTPASVSCCRPTIVRMSPRWIFVFGQDRDDRWPWHRARSGAGTHRGHRATRPAPPVVLPSTALLVT